MERLPLTKTNTETYVRDGESVLRVAEIPPRIFTHTPSSKKQLLRLAGATDEKSIGRHGPTLASLHMEYDQDAPEALRLYEALFGRDSLRVAADLLELYPNLARTTVLELASMQGSTYKTYAEEEPGKIPHEVRDPHDPIAIELTKRNGWQWPYYGSVDATTEFVRTIADYCQNTSESYAFLFQSYDHAHGETRIIADSLSYAVDWIERKLDETPDGILEYKSKLPPGVEIENQVWKDSWDSYHHSDGTIANHNHGIASIEVQISAYEALLGAADIYENGLNRAEKAIHLRDRAAYLANAINELFWTEDKGGFYVIGTDRDDSGSLRQLAIRTSDMGHVLNSSLLEVDTPNAAHKVRSLVNQLLSEDMLNVSGIRTLARDETRFRPGAYHNGSVWPWDTYHIAKGLRRHGYDAAAIDLEDRILNIVDTVKLFPEYVSGSDNDTPHINRHVIEIHDIEYDRVFKAEQPPQEVQAWTVAAVRAIEASRGL